MQSIFFKGVSCTILVILCCCQLSFTRKPKSGKHKASLRQLARLPGTWKNKTTNGNSYESWTKVNDTLFRGISYMVKGSDTVVLEHIDFLQTDGSLFYVPTVTRQNGGQPVIFALKSFSENSFIFENAAHDFPQLITYKLFHKDSLVAEISGTKNGIYKSIQFPMKQVH